MLYWIHIDITWTGEVRVWIRWSVLIQLIKTREARKWNTLPVLLCGLLWSFLFLNSRPTPMHFFTRSKSVLWCEPPQFLRSTVLFLLVQHIIKHHRRFHFTSITFRSMPPTDFTDSKMRYWYRTHNSLMKARSALTSMENFATNGA